MTRVLLIGRGPLPTPDQRHTGFAQLRTAHFQASLRAAGHEVDLLCVTDDHAAGLLAEATRRAGRADLIISAGPHRPGALAVAVAGDRPLHIDLPGAPLAELQALVRAPGHTIPLSRLAAAHAMARTCLARADHISTISRRQEHAVLGQLALMGRTDAIPAPTCTVPIAFDFPLPRRSARTLPTAGPVRLMLSGAFAPWLDDEGLARGLDIALSRQPRLEVHATGGGIQGHYTEGYTRFSRWARASPVSDRIHLHGWVPHADLEALLGRAHVGLCLDRPGAEPTLGSRTRVLLYAWMGLHIAASAETELVADLVARDLATPLPVQDDDGEGIAAALERVLEAPSTTERATAAADHLRARYHPDAIARPLTRFVQAPQRHPTATDPTARVAAELEALQAQLAAVHGSPTWRVLSRLHRLLTRR